MKPGELGDWWAKVQIAGMVLGMLLTLIAWLSGAL